MLLSLHIEAAVLSITFKSFDKISPKDLPSSYFSSETAYIRKETGEENARSLIIKCKDRNQSGTVLELVYTVFEDCDCITRSAKISNIGDSTIKVHNLKSLQLDLDYERVKILSFHGDWAREMRAEELSLAGGKYVIDSATGFSSNRQNPFFIVGEPYANEYYGECYGFNLIYSGGHKEVVEMTSHGKTHIVTGLREEDGSFILSPKEELWSPEAVMTYSDTGYEGISIAMHEFVREHIVRGIWKKNTERNCGTLL